MTTSILPPFAATAPDGTRIVVHPHTASDSVEELARALDLEPSTALAVDGCPVERHQRLVDIELRVGSSITVRPTDAAAEHPEAVEPGREQPERECSTPVVHRVEVSVASGPACAPWRTLTVGRHTVGRAAVADVCIHDPAVELHHGVLDVDADGAISFTQLTGRVPATIGGVACSATHQVGPGCAIRLGSSELLVRTMPCPMPADCGLSSGRSSSVGSIVASDVDPWRRVVRRAPPVAATGPVQPIEVPEAPGEHRPPPLTSLVGAGVAVAGAGLLAAVLGQAMFAMFAAIGAVASLATWAVGAIVARRQQRRAATAHQVAVGAFRDALRRSQREGAREHRATHLSVVDALEMVDGDGGRLWSRRATADSPLRATVGRGSCRWIPPIDADRRRSLDPELLVAIGDCERLVDVPVPVTLPRRSVLAIHGPSVAGTALCRSIVMQLAVTYGPSDWQLLVVSNRPEQWGWVGWLPHASDGAAAVVDAADTGALVAALDRSAVAAPSGAPVGGVSDDAARDREGRQLLVVLDVPELLTTRTGPLRRRFDQGDVSCIVVVAPDASVPAMATRVFVVGETARGRWADTADHSAWDIGATDVYVAGISLAVTESAARRLAPLVDPEGHDGAGGVPARISLAALEQIDAGTSTTIARRWRSGGPDPAPVARLGMSADGVVDIDLVRDGPHGLIAGTTGAGKSELLRTLVVTLAAQVSPDHLTMVLVDFKGGSTFDACARLPHTVGVVTDLDDGLAERVLVSLDAEVRRRERLLRAAGADDLAGYRRTSDVPLPRLVVVIDEFASLAKELPDFLHALVDVAQRGRSLGVHLILATQRPAGVVTDDIRANTNLRIALRLQDRSDATDVVGDVAPATFPVGAPGRAALRLGPSELVTFQTADSSAPPPAHATRLSIEWCHGAGRAPSGASEPGGASALVRLTDAICEAAIMVGVPAPHRPWIDALPSRVTPRQLAQELSLSAADPLNASHTASPALGLVDDPAHQCRAPLRWQPGDGNLLLVGSVGSGTTTAAVALVAASARVAAATDVHVYVVDARGDDVWNDVDRLAHCGGVIRIRELERLTRLLKRLADEMDRRSMTGDRVPQVVTVIDGVAAVREALGDVSMTDVSLRLDRLLRDGPALGLSTCVTTDGSSTSALSLPRSATWVFRLDDPAVARSLGIRAAPTATVPGRLRIAESGLDAQIVFDTDPFSEVGVSAVAAGGPERIIDLPDVVDAAALDASTEAQADRGAVARSADTTTAAGDQPLRLVVGLAADDIEPALLLVPAGDHVFIGGGARTGRSTALRQVEASWRRLHPGGVVERVDRHHPLADHLDATFDVHAAGPVLVLADDADRIDDVDGRLAALIASRTPGVTIVAAARLEAVRVAYGHWTREVARSRCGLIMTSTGDVDGELLGATLPRRSMIPPRPGLAWVVDQRGHRLVQVAARLHP